MTKPPVMGIIVEWLVLALLDSLEPQELQETS